MKRIRGCALNVEEGGVYLVVQAERSAIVLMCIYKAER